MALSSRNAGKLRSRAGSLWLALSLAAALIAVTACSGSPGVTGPVHLDIDAGAEVYPFRPTMRGVAMNNWNWLWSGIAEEGSPRREALLTAARQLNPGVIRFAGGLWANNVGWDRHGVAPVDGEWTFTDPDDGESFTYRHAYKPEMIDSYAAFAGELGAETIVQVNLCDDNPAMWADLLRYTNVEHAYAFRYWELGNEIDLDRCISQDEYARRFIAYRTALKAVDPSIQVLGPSVSMPTRTDWIDTLVNSARDELDVLAFHWYQLTQWSKEPDSFAYQAGSIEALLSHGRGVGEACQRGFACPGELISPSRLNRTTYRRGLAEAASAEIIGPFRAGSPGAQVAITEMGPHATLHESPINGNHIAAVWLADMLGRWAYNGLDILTYYSLEDGATGSGNTRGLLGVDGPEALDVRPTYLAEWLYAAHFGDMLVKSSSDHWDQGVSVWASTDSDDPGALKLIIVNLTGKSQETVVSVSGFSPSTGEAYVVSSADPSSMEDPASFAEHTTTINGLRVPDVSLDDPGLFARTLEAIAPTPVPVSGKFEYEIGPYSVASLTLR
jgi:hypothetical protein